MFCCLFIPDFPAEAILRFEPELRARAVVVLAGRPPLERVVSMNENAHQLGVEVEALKAQLEAYDELVLRTRSESQENSAHAALLDCAQSFSPEVEDTAPDAVLLNLAGLESLFGLPSQIINQLAERAWQMGLKINVAAAANPDAAFLAAHGFSGVTLVAEGFEAQRLGGLPVDVLFETFSQDADQSARWLETFDRWGVRNLRSLAALPEVPVSERLGQEGVRLQKLARGAVSRQLRLFEPQPVFEENIELEYPIVLLEPLAFLLNRMLEQVCTRLESRALAAQELQLSLELAVDLEPETQGLKPVLSESDDAGLKARSSTAKGGILFDNHALTAKPRTSTFTRTLRLPVPMLNAKTFLKLLQLDLQAHPPGAPIVKIHLSAEPAKPRAVQSGLFQPFFPEPEKLELTLARIEGIVGEGRVGSAELLDTHREGAFAMRHFAPSEPEANGSQKKVVVVEQREDIEFHQPSMQEAAADLESSLNPESTEPPILVGDVAGRMSAVIALRLFRPPLRAVVNVHQGKPVKLKCIHREDICGEIIWSAGPWRSSGDWSEQEGWSRDEWDIAVPAESGLTLYRLVEDRLSRNWFVEGAYD
jgi:protein ImuB